MAHKVEGREEADRHTHTQSHVLEGQSAPPHGWRVLRSPPLQPQGCLICPHPPCEEGLRSWQGHCSRTDHTVATRFCGSAGRCQARSLHPPEHLQKGVSCAITAGILPLLQLHFCADQIMYSNKNGCSCAVITAKLSFSSSKTILKGMKLVVSTTLVLSREQQLLMESTDWVHYGNKGEESEWRSTRLALACACKKPL